jgi:hypothetical protein
LVKAVPAANALKQGAASPISRPRRPDTPIEPDPRDVLVPYPPNLMRMWPISTRVNKPDHDDVSILDLDEQ